MFFKMLKQKQTEDTNKVSAPKEDDTLSLEALCGDPALIVAAQELNQLRETCN